MALEAWSHERLERGEDVEAVLRDILGPEGSCAAYLLIALDVLLSHWPATRDALVPFVANPDLLASDRTRLTLERLGGAMMLQKEPMLVARDGEDALLDKHEDWVRTVIATALAEKVDHYGSNERLDFHRPAQGICGLIHLWRRKQLVSDRNQLLRTVARQDHAAVLAITAARKSIHEVNPQLIKAAVRIAFTSCRWRWHPYDEDESTREAYEKEKAGQDADAIAAEITWLDGGPEPNWPDLTEEKPSFSRQPRAMISPNGTRTELNRDDDSFRRGSREAVTRVDNQGLARWVSLLRGEGSALPSGSAMIARKDHCGDAPRAVTMPISGSGSDFSKQYEGLRVLLLPQCFHGGCKRRRRPGGRLLSV